MVDGLATLVSVDFRAFKMDRLQPGILNGVYMFDHQLEDLGGFVEALKRDVSVLVKRHPLDTGMMELMDVKPQEVGYVSITVQNPRFEGGKIKDWGYRVVHLTKSPDGNPGMAFGDTNYTRSEVEELRE